MTVSGALKSLSALSAQNRCAKITYRKPGEEWVTERIIEAYSVAASGRHLILLTWQVEPFLDETDSWRNFRVDRIVTVKDALRVFQPRAAITLSEGATREFVFDDRPERGEP